MKIQSDYYRKIVDKLDGQTIKVPRNKLDLIRQVNEQLTKETGLVIEEVLYSKMFLRDVD